MVNSRSKPLALMPHDQIPIDQKSVWSLEDAALATTLSKRTIQKAIRSGDLTCIRVGRRVLLFPDAIRAWLASLQDIPATKQEKV